MEENAPGNVTDAARVASPQDKLQAQLADTVTPPSAAHRYSVSCHPESSESDLDDRTPNVCIEASGDSLLPNQALDEDVLTPLANTGRQQGGLHTATRVFLSRFSSSSSRSPQITVQEVGKQLSLPVTDVHALLAVLEALEVCSYHIHFQCVALVAGSSCPRQACMLVTT